MTPEQLTRVVACELAGTRLHVPESMMNTASYEWRWWDGSSLLAVRWIWGDDCNKQLTGRKHSHVGQQCTGCGMYVCYWCGAVSAEAEEAFRC